MIDRLKRLVRSWVGFFISMGEDPEVMLQEAVEEMRSTMPRLNQVLVATRATVIRLDEEKTRLERQERELVTSIKAALQEGSAAARSLAEEEAAQLQQLRMDLANTREQLAAAQKAFDGSKMTVDALKAKLQDKIQEIQRAVKERQKAQVMRQASEAITELQSYGVASTADKFLEQIKQEVAESKAAVETAVGGLDTASIEKERMARKLKASSILAEFEAEMGLKRPAAVTPSPADAPTVGTRVGEKH
jgi:phage shock protein A